MSARKPVVHLARGEEYDNACGTGFLGCAVWGPGGRCIAVYCQERHAAVTCKRCLAKLRRGKP